MTSSLHKETTTKKEDRLSQNLSFSHVCRSSNSVWSREFMQTFISTACRVVIKSRGPGIFPGYKRVAPGYFYWKRKIGPKEIPSRLIPRLLVVFTRQLEILVTTLLHALKSI